MKWIQLNAGGSIGFNTAAEAEAFLLTQSKNPDWLAQFQIKYNVGNGGKLQCYITTENHVVLQLV
jgi:phosphoglucomutase